MLKNILFNRCWKTANGKINVMKYGGQQQITWQEKPWFDAINAVPNTTQKLPTENVKKPGIRMKTAEKRNKNCVMICHAKMWRNLQTLFQNILQVRNYFIIFFKK